MTRIPSNQQDDTTGFAPDGRGWSVNQSEGVAVGPAIPFAGLTITPLVEKITDRTDRIDHIGLGETRLTFDVAGQIDRTGALEDLQQFLMLLQANIDDPRWGETA